MKKVFAVLILASAFALPLSAAEKVLYHVVSFKFKDGVTAEQIQKIEEAFRALKTKIPQVASYVSGHNVSKEDRAKGFAHMSILTFKSQEDLDTYINHPEHQAFKGMLKDVIAEAFVYDFWDSTEK